jgi:hypothetical protein
MAIGVFTFAIVPIIGLLNVGLNVSKDSVDTFAISQIVRQAESQTILSGTSSLNGTFYFLNTGEADASSGHVNAVYQATLTGTTTTDAAQGLIARSVVKIEIFRANTTTSICKRALQISKDPEDLQTYFP